ncbi:MAG: glycoside hydrolase family 1 protein [Spiroplasma sp.]
MKKFPKDFIFSASTCAFQIEGGRNLGQRKDSIWDKFTKENYYIPKPNEAKREINSIAIASDFFHKYPTDIKIMAKLDLDALVYNLDWARIMPDSIKINQQGVTFYQNVFKELLKNKIKIIPILFHWDTPLWIEKFGSWTNRKILEVFRIYCQVMFKHFGKMSDIWFVNDETSTFTLTGYLDDYLPPAKKSPLDFVKALHFLNLSAAIAKEEFLIAKEKNFVNRKAKIGIVHDWSPPIPFLKSEQEIVKQYNYWFKDLFLDPNFKGTYPKVFYQWIKENKLDFKMSEEDLDYLQKYPMDLLGWNYYRPVYVANANLHEKLYKWQKPSEKHFSKSFKIVYPKASKKIKYTQWNWVIDPSLLASGAKELFDNYQVPIMIVENGLGTFDTLEAGMILDYQRIDYLSSHLAEVLKAIENKVPLIGYSLWTYCDIFSPSGGYRKRYGLVRVDFEQKDLPRTPKLSYVWYRNVIKSRKNPTNYNKENLIKDLQKFLEKWDLY